MYQAWLKMPQAFPSYGCTCIDTHVHFYKHRLLTTRLQDCMQTFVLTITLNHIQVQKSTLVLQTTLRRKVLKVTQRCLTLENFTFVCSVCSSNVDKSPEYYHVFLYYNIHNLIDDINKLTVTSGDSGRSLQARILSNNNRGQLTVTRTGSGQSLGLIRPTNLQRTGVMLRVIVELVFYHIWGVRFHSKQHTARTILEEYIKFRLKFDLKKKCQLGNIIRSSIKITWHLKVYFHFILLLIRDYLSKSLCLEQALSWSILVTKQKIYVLKFETEKPFCELQP